jgi:hypothetical protein
VVVAGGGGGAGADSSQCGTPGAGGSGGGGAGAPGPAQHADCSPGGGGGAGGTDTGGGRGGDAFYVFDHHSGDGSFGVGGTALGDDASDAVGGGGGGGWYGGGAGAGLYQSFAGSGGGGGGGSNHVVAGARDVVVASGVNTGAARVTITPLATPTVSFTTSYSKPEADRLHAFATRTHRSDAQAQHDAALSLARLLDAFVRAHPDQTRGSRSMDRGDWLAFAFGRHATVGVTSTYSVQDGAVVTRVSRLLWLSESSFQRFAVAVISRIPPG